MNEKLEKITFDDINPKKYAKEIASINESVEKLKKNKTFQKIIKRMKKEKLKNEKK